MKQVQGESMKNARLHKQPQNMIYAKKGNANWILDGRQETTCTRRRWLNLVLHREGRKEITLNKCQTPQ